MKRKAAGHRANLAGWKKRRTTLDKSQTDVEAHGRGDTAGDGNSIGEKQRPDETGNSGADSPRRESQDCEARGVDTETPAAHQSSADEMQDGGGAASARPHPRDPFDDMEEEVCPCPAERVSTDCLRELEAKYSCRSRASQDDLVGYADTSATHRKCASSHFSSVIPL